MKMWMKICALAIAVMLLAFALADTPPLNSGLFSDAKNALVCLNNGEFERLVTLLRFNGVAPGASEWQNFAYGNFSTLGNGVQTTYAVAYWSDGAWKIAVPVSEPSDGGVEALVLLSGDGQTFSGYRYARWSQVDQEVQGAAYSVWNQEYFGASPSVASD